MKTPKFIVVNKSSCDDIELFGSILEVLKLGLISDDGKKYCYATRFYGKEYKFYIYTQKTKYGYAITVDDDD